MENFKEFEKKNLTLIRSGRVFDTYVVKVSDSQENIIKHLIMDNKKGKKLFYNELAILKKLDKFDGENFCKLVAFGDNYFSIEFIKHSKLIEGKIYSILKRNRNLLRKLSVSLAEFSSIEFKDNDITIKDKFLISVIKSFVKLILKNKIKIGLIGKFIKCIGYIFIYKKYDLITLSHNDLRDENVLVNEDTDKIYIIDYDRSTTAQKFICRDVMQFCLLDTVINDWSWQYEFIESYIQYIKKESEERYHLLVGELSNIQTLKNYIIARMILNLNSTKYTRKVAEENLSYVFNKDYFLEWHKNFMLKINVFPSKG